MSFLFFVLIISHTLHDFNLLASETILGSSVRHLHLHRHRRHYLIRTVIRSNALNGFGFDSKI